MERQPAQEAVGSLGWNEGLPDNAVNRSRANVAHFVIIVIQGVVEGEQRGQVVVGPGSFSSDSEE